MPLLILLHSNNVIFSHTLSQITSNEKFDYELNVQTFNPFAPFLSHSSSIHSSNDVVINSSEDIREKGDRFGRGFMLLRQSLTKGDQEPFPCK